MLKTSNYSQATLRFMESAKLRRSSRIILRWSVEEMRLSEVQSLLLVRNSSVRVEVFPQIAAFPLHVWEHYFHNSLKLNRNSRSVTKMSVSSRRTETSLDKQHYSSRSSEVLSIFKLHCLWGSLKFLSIREVESRRAQGGWFWCFCGFWFFWESFEFFVVLCSSNLFPQSD